jgi:hypothetical protein
VTCEFAHARGIGPRMSPVPRIRLSRFTINTLMKLFFAGVTHAGESRVREQIRVTLKTPLEYPINI